MTTAILPDHATRTVRDMGAEGMPPSQRQTCTKPAVIGRVKIGGRRYRYGADDADHLIDAALRAIEARCVREDAPFFASPDIAARYARLKLAEREVEVFACFFLDTRHRLIAYREMFTGTIDGCSVHPREVVRVALELNAAAVIFAHNHPSGVTEPSNADQQITRRLKDALSLIDVRLLDHFVVGTGGWDSLALRGVI